MTQPTLPRSGLKSQINLNKKYSYSIVLLYDYTKIADLMAVKNEIEENYSNENKNNFYCKNNIIQ